MELDLARILFRITRYTLELHTWHNQINLHIKHELDWEFFLHQRNIVFKITAITYLSQNYRKEPVPWRSLINYKKKKTVNEDIQQAVDKV